LQDFVPRDFPDERQKAKLRRSPERGEWARRDVVLAAPCAFFPFAKLSRGLNSSVAEVNEWKSMFVSVRAKRQSRPRGKAAIAFGDA
jgi:hypothetical protein